MNPLMLDLGTPELTVMPIIILVILWLVIRSAVRSGTKDRGPDKKPPVR